MKYLFTFFAFALPLSLLAQQQQRIALEDAEAIHIHANFSSVALTTGGTNTLMVDHVFTVDGADRPDLRQLSIEREGNVLHLREVKPNARLMQRTFPEPKGRMITGGREGGKGIFNNVVVDATLRVTVPAGIRVTVETDYGGIEAVNVAGLVSAKARYGNVAAVFTQTSPQPNLELYSNYGTVDLTVPTGVGLNLDLTTEYGDLLTDMTIDVDAEASTEKAFYQRVVGSVGGGGRVVSCHAPYGDVYLREG